MSRRDLFTGKAGGHAVSSQLLIRQWQVAVPAVDVGDDHLIAQDLSNVVRVQVKASRATEQKQSYVARFSVPVKQFTTPGIPDLIYVFAVFRHHVWSDFIIVPRRELHDEYALNQMPADRKKMWTLRIRLDAATVRCGKHDWSRFRDNWPTANGTLQTHSPNGVLRVPTAR